MARDEIIDIDQDPKLARQAVRQRLLRYGLPIFAILLITGGLIAGTLYTNSMNRADVLGLSRDFIDALSEQVHTELRVYLSPAQTAVTTLAAAVPDDPWSESGRGAFERMGLDVLTRNRQLASVYYGLPNGAFLMVRRNQAGSADTKRIDPIAADTYVQWTRRNADGSIAALETDPDDKYDPTGRGWYRDSAENSGIRWSKVYTFFTDRTPGITASVAVRRRGYGLTAVVGVDIFLNNLSELLANLQSKARGTLAIVNAEGQVIAFHQPEKVVVDTDDGVRSRHINELDIPELAEAFDRLRVEGPARSVVAIDGANYIIGAASLQAAVSRDWWLILLAPEEAYLGFIATNSQRGLIASSGIVVLAIILAAFLAYQGYRVDRNNRAMGKLTDSFTTYRRLLAGLAEISNLSDPQEDRDLTRVSEILAEAEAARRISFWHIRPGRDLTCLHAFESASRSHIAGIALPADACQDLFKQMAAGEMVEILDTSSDPRAAGIHLTYFHAVETQSVYSIPIVSGNQALGAIWIEDPDAQNAVTRNHNLSRTVANLLSGRLQALSAADISPSERASQHAGVGRERAEVQQSALPDGAVRHAISLAEKRQALDLTVADNTEHNMAVYPNCTVLFFKFFDDQFLSADDSATTEDTLIRDVVGTFEAVADRYNITYLKFLTDQIVAIDGFGGDAEDAAERLVDVALTVRAQCADIFIAAGRGPQFAIGLDTGTVYGTSVGIDDAVFNVWGETVRVASQLAATADAGTIQVSESGYDILHSGCIFRRRGAFFLDRLGEMTTYNLRGRV